MSETELAADIVAYFQDLQYEVYQEVKCYDSVADIVAVLRGKPDLYHIVEVKKSLTFQVIAQAVHWRFNSHYVSVAIPKEKGRWDRPSKGRGLAYRVLEWQGVGCLVAGTSKGAAQAAVRPVLNRQARTDQLTLHEAQKTFAAAGNAEGKFWSPYKGTCDAILRLLTRTGPLPVSEVIRQIEHHYASDANARSSLMKWAQMGKIKGVRLDVSTKPMTFRLEHEHCGNRNEDAS